MKRILRTSLILAILLGMVCTCGEAWAAERKGLGDLGFDPIDYDMALKQYPPSYEMAVPSSFDWRDYGVVTVPKDQGWCGSCWAFACVGVMESKILLAGGPMYDLSEQQQISCNFTMSGCCGGSYTALTYWNTNNPWEEVCTGYGDYTTGCGLPEVSCGTLSCSDMPYNSTNMFTVNTSNVDSVKNSINQDGPAYFRYDVYSDFFTYWSTVSPGTVYTQTSGIYEGGHAVLIIGWDDSKQAWLCKNSWGATGGPNGDGTFWIAWTGHAHNLSFGMANIELAASQLTKIDLLSPSNQSNLSLPPDFAWSSDGGANNVYAVDFAFSLSGPVYSTYNNLHELTYNTNWSMPTWLWNMIPSGSHIFWRVRGADLDVYPLTVVSSDQVWEFQKN